MSNFVSNDNATTLFGDVGTKKISWAGVETSVKKNLLKNTATTTSKNGGTFTVNSDGSIAISTDANGFTANTAIRLYRGSLPKGSFLCNGLPDGGASTYKLQIAPTSGGDAVNVFGDDVSFTNNSDDSWDVNLTVYSGQVFTTPVTIYPMIRPASIKNSDYAPYIPDNAELDANKANETALAPVENGATASRAYAVGEHFMRDGAFCTVKSAIASGGSFALNTNYMVSSVGNRVASNAYTNLNAGIATVTRSDVIINEYAVMLKIDITIGESDVAEWTPLMKLTALEDKLLQIGDMTIIIRNVTDNNVGGAATAGYYGTGLGLSFKLLAGKRYQFTILSLR